MSRPGGNQHQVDDGDGERDDGDAQADGECHPGTLETVGGVVHRELDPGRPGCCPRGPKWQVQQTRLHSRSLWDPIEIRQRSRLVLVEWILAGVIFR